MLDLIGEEMRAFRWLVHPKMILKSGSWVGITFLRCPVDVFTFAAGHFGLRQV